VSESDLAFHRNFRIRLVVDGEPELASGPESRVEEKDLLVVVVSTLANDADAKRFSGACLCLGYSGFFVAVYHSQIAVFSVLGVRDQYDSEGLTDAVTCCCGEATLFEDLHATTRGISTFTTIDIRGELGLL